MRSTVRNFQGFELHVDAGWVFSLENTQWNYLPEDSTDTTNTNVPCPACPDGKKPSYFAYISAGYGTVDPAVLAAPITFELSLPNGVTGYRLGSSSNFGTQTASDPDYKFLAEGNSEFNAPTSNGQSITTNGSVNGAVVTVTSFDYGGVALLRAKAQIGGTWIYASAGARYDELGDQLPSPSCAVAGSDTRGFVQVPIDMDCNWIADSWEFEPAMQALQVPHFPKYWDQEKTGPNADSNVVPGDGYGAYDEYRGFHILEKLENSANYIPTHKRTEATRLDSFYSSKPSQEPLGSDLRLILESRLQGIVKFHRIAPDQFELLQQDPIQTRFFNRNTESLLNPTNFPVILTAAPAGQGYCIGTFLGLTASYQNGDLTICTDAIRAASVNDPDFEAVIRARIVAHEYGHRFHLDHYFEDRIHYPSKVTQSQAPSIVQGGGFYAEDQLSGKTLYTKLRYYQKQNGPTVQQVDSLSGDSLALNNNSCPPENGTIIIGTSTATLVLLDGTGLYNCAEELSTNLLFYKSPIRVQTYRQGRIMSWAFEPPIESKLASGHAFSNASPNDISLIQVKE